MHEPIDMDPVAVRARHLDYIKQRYDRGDMIFSRNTVGVLLQEMADLSERCLTKENKPKKARPFAGRCEERAKKGTGEGTCDAPMVNGFCPRWRDHLEMEQD